MQHLTFPDDRLVLNGLWWFAETAPRLRRLPGRLEGLVTKDVWKLSQDPSGARIRLATNTTTLTLKVAYGQLGSMKNMCRIGQMGIDLYVDGDFWKPVWPEETGQSQFTLFSDLASQRREVTLYLPLYHPVAIEAIGIDEDATIWEPNSFAVAKPVAFYGSSITQGGCASHAGMSYQAILGRMLNIDYINLGFSGAGRGEPVMARAFAEIDASLFVVDFAQNCETVEELRQNYAPFLDTIRQAHPDTPVVCITPIFSNYELFEDDHKCPTMRQVIREAVAARKQAGDINITIVEGMSLLSGADSDCFVDGIHPNDLGFQRIAERLAPAVRGVLCL